MASDYERATWRTAIRDLLGRVAGTTSRPISTSELHSLLSSKKLPMVCPLLNIDDLAFDEELLFGQLNTTICRLQGVTDTKEVHCTVEVDSFGQFSTKAKTKVASLPSVVWNENFEIELDGSQTVRVLVHSGGVMIGMCALELSKDWLTEQFQEKTVSINKEMSVTISLSYSSRSREWRCQQQALPATAGAVFGVSLQEVPKREGSQVPFVIAACIEEIESRGLEEEGLYRISGATSDIQKLKKTFEKKSKSALQQLVDADIAALTGLVKLYFRELPDGLLTSQIYRDIVKSRSLTEPEAKCKYIESLLSSLPEPNKSTMCYIVDHILRVADHEASNRMSLRNLAMVFGPTLLRCSSRSHGAQTLEQLVSKGPHEVVIQSSLLLTILELRASGVQF